MRHRPRVLACEGGQRSPCRVCILCTSGGKGGAALAAPCAPPVPHSSPEAPSPEGALGGGGRTAHTTAVRSLEPVASMPPLCEKARCHTSSVWASSTWGRQRVRAARVTREIQWALTDRVPSAPAWRERTHLHAS